MKRWVVRVKAQIDDTFEVEAENEWEARESADKDWSFVEAHSWEIVSVEEVEK